MLDAKKAFTRRDMKIVKAKMHASKRLRAQIHDIEVSAIALDDNIDAIINSDIQREIIGGLKWSTEAMRDQMVPMGGVEGVSETVSDLERELQNAKEISEALFNMPMMTNIMTGSADEDGWENAEDSLLHELNALLLDEDEEPLHLPSVPSSVPSSSPNTPAFNKAQTQDLLTGRDEDAITSTMQHHASKKSLHKRQVSVSFASPSYQSQTSQSQTSQTQTSQSQTPQSQMGVGNSHSHSNGNGSSNSPGEQAGVTALMDDMVGGLAERALEF